MNMTMLKKFGRLLKLRQWVNTMTYTLEVMCSCWLMYLKASERPAYNIIHSIPVITSPPPALSWDAMLKMTNIKLELMVDVDMYQFIEKGMRGGVSYIANRYGKANNKYMKEYNDKAPSKYIMYLDANNLYGWAMSQYLPRYLQMDKEISKIDLGKYKADGKKGLILEVDLEYPQELHDLHNDYPVCPEKVKVSNDMLSGYCKEIANKFNISIGLVSKLIPTLRDKKE